VKIEKAALQRERNSEIEKEKHSDDKLVPFV